MRKHMSWILIFLPKKPFLKSVIKLGNTGETLLVVTALPALRGNQKPVDSQNIILKKVNHAYYVFVNKFTIGKCITQEIFWL